MLGILAAGCLTLGGAAVGLQKEQRGDDKHAPDEHGSHYEKCARACTRCMRECESCALHCAKLVSQGHKEHMKTLGTCLDCSEFCVAAAKIISHHGPLSSTICEACAKACDVCGAACAKFADDKHMQRCAQACRDCAQACREMVRHVGRDDGTTPLRETPAQPRVKDDN